MQEIILVVDDDKAILNYTAKLLTEVGANVLTCNSPVKALSIIRDEPVAIVVSDYYMPEMTGLELFHRMREFSHSIVKILMTSKADLDMAVGAINSGEVFRFLSKPWQDAEMIAAVRDGVRRYRMLRASSEDMEFLLHALGQTIELKDTLTKGHCDRVATYAEIIARKLGLDMEAKHDIKVGSWLHDCGKIGVPEAILNADRGLNDEEMEVIRKHPLWGATVAEAANMPAMVVNIVLHHHEYYNGGGYPLGLAGQDIPLEARIVAAADVYDALRSSRPYRPGFSYDETRGIMQSMSGKQLDPAILATLFDGLEAHRDKSGDHPLPPRLN
ncbi:HD domain-containing phosphohydrolase [Geobacter sp. AOG2]|uniref:HD domain-containing phosphohydrolase n=1 Tax=Geobacter sp. AOG2 TaxID=1566347 RepID=UPI001CC60C04|nr:HD domain-containing phosphohydrolase [Geobacter sp. AOG2]GFE61716.1 two-component system response regulator [Geobacter sp. AOG2]